MKYIALFRGKATSVLAGFLWVLYPGGIGIWRCWVLWTEESGRNDEKSSEQSHEPTTNSTHTWRWNQTRATLARSERSHHCAIRAPITAAKLYHAGTQKPNLCLQYFFLLEQPSKSERPWKFLLGNAESHQSPRWIAHAWMPNTRLNWVAGAFLSLIFIVFKISQSRERRNSRELHELKVRQYRFLSWSLHNKLFFLVKVDKTERKLMEYTCDSRWAKNCSCSVNEALPGHMQSKLSPWVAPYGSTKWLAMRQCSQE